MNPIRAIDWPNVGHMAARGIANALMVLAVSGVLALIFAPWLIPLLLGAYK